MNNSNDQQSTSVRLRNRVNEITSPNIEMLCKMRSIIGNKLASLYKTVSWLLYMKLHFTKHTTNELVLSQK